MIPMIGAAIVRTSGNLLGPMWLDGERRDRLVADRLGLLIGSVPTYESMVRRVAALKNYNGGRWVAVVASKELANTTCDFLEGEGLPFQGNLSAGPWKLSSLTIATVEQLRQIDPSRVEGVILLDPTCMVHKARRWQSVTGFTHDRPQRIVDFLAKTQAFGQAGAVFALMTTQPAKSLPTERIASVYCLEGWQCIDGVSARFARTLPTTDESPGLGGIVRPR